MKHNLSCSSCPCTVEPLLIFALHPILFWCYFSLDKDIQAWIILSVSLKKFPPHNPLVSEGLGPFSWKVSTALGRLSKQVKENPTNALEHPEQGTCTATCKTTHKRASANLLSNGSFVSFRDYSQILQWTHFPGSSAETEIMLHFTQRWSSGVLPLCSDLEVIANYTSGNHLDAHVQACCTQNNLIKAFI